MARKRNVIKTCVWLDVHLFTPPPHHHHPINVKYWNSPFDSCFDYLMYLRFKVDGFTFNWSLSVFKRKFLESLLEADTAAESEISVCWSHFLFFLAGCDRLKQQNNIVGSIQFNFVRSTDALITSYKRAITMRKLRALNNFTSTSLHFYITHRVLLLFDVWIYNDFIQSSFMQIRI